MYLNTSFNANVTSQINAPPPSIIIATHHSVWPAKISTLEFITRIKKDATHPIRPSKTFGVMPT